MRLPQLDLLRALAVCLVLASHVDPAPKGMDAISSVLIKLFKSYGQLGVDLFLY
jgi:peptidoglycan/LPS O-acetylase OafA/YrhL